jgi:hypothetical protein
VKVLILTLDTRGDVQPFVALPRGLANAGHEAVPPPRRLTSAGAARDQPTCAATAADWPDAVHGDRLLVPGRHRARAITSPRALKAA